MRKTFLIPALLAGLTLAGAGYAKGEGSHDFPRRAGEIMREFEPLNLTDAQKQTVKDMFDGGATQFRAEHRGIRNAHRTYMLTVPGTPAATAAATQLADAEADSARLRIQRHEEMRAKIYGILTDEQKSQFVTLMQKHADEMDQRHRGSH